MTDTTGGVVLLLALVGTLLFAAAWTLADFSSTASRLWRRGAAVPPLVLGLALVTHAAGEDTYRHDGTSRWQAYDAELITGLAVIAAVGAGVVGYAARDRAHLGAAAAWACALSFVLTYLALMQMTN